MCRRVLLAALLFVFLGSASMCFADQADETKETINGYFASFELRHMRRAVSFIGKDPAAFVEMVTRDLIWPLKGGLSVFVEDRLDNGIVKVRPRGEIYSIYIIKEAIGE